MINKQDILNFKWEDARNISHNIGMLAQDGEDFYVIFKRIKEQSPEYKSGYRGVPGFIRFPEKLGLHRQRKIYKSSTMFDFFVRRLQDKNTQDPMAELLKEGARSAIDSFYLADDIPEEEKLEYIEEIKRRYKIQERLRAKRMLSSKEKVGEN